MPARRSIDLYLLRHGHSTANGKGVLAGRDNSVALSELGRSQAAAAAQRLSVIEIDRIISSPISRCLETLKPVIESKSNNFRSTDLEIDNRLAEMDYGTWSGRKLILLSKRPLWKEIQRSPSTVRFPEGESFVEMSARISDLLSSLSYQKGKKVLLCSHGDIIKAIIAHALGLHLDQFQRIVISPASLSHISIQDDGFLVHTVNDVSFHPNASNSTSKKKKRAGSLLLGGGSGSR